MAGLQDYVGARGAYLIALDFAGSDAARGKLGHGKRAPSSTATEATLFVVFHLHEIIRRRTDYSSWFFKDATRPGDIAGIITFVGGDATQISATVQVKQDSKLLLLERSHFESLLNTNPAIVYYVMRGIVRHVHGIVRRMNMQSVEMSNYIHRTGGRY